MNILTISGSQRAASFNSAVIRALPELAPEGHTLTQLDYSQLPIFNQDLEAEFPNVVTEAKNHILAADAIIISTPEYNRSIPAALKNLMDWTSRPYGQGAWVGKHVYVMGASIGHTGTVVAQADLRKVLLFLDAHVHGQPELYIGTASQKVSAEHVLTDEDTKNHIRSALATFLSSVS